jgi:hypothetical protein
MGSFARPVATRMTPVQSGQPVLVDECAHAMRIKSLRLTTCTARAQVLLLREGQCRCQDLDRWWGTGDVVGVQVPELHFRFAERGQTGQRAVTRSIAAIVWRRKD